MEYTTTTRLGMVPYQRRFKLTFAQHFSLPHTSISPSYKSILFLPRPSPPLLSILRFLSTQHENDELRMNVAKKEKKYLPF